MTNAEKARAALVGDIIVDLNEAYLELARAYAYEDDAAGKLWGMVISYLRDWS